MGRKSKRQQAGYKNVQNSGHFRAAADKKNQQETTAGDTDDDNYEPPTKQPRKFQNQSSTFLMVVSVLNSILEDFTVCRACRVGFLQCDVTSYSCVNTNLVFECNHCKIIRKKWSGPTNISHAAMMAAKYAGMKIKQLQYWLSCMNFGFTNDNGKQYAVNLSKSKSIQINEDINIKLHEMKECDEAMFHQQLLEQTDNGQVELAIDGMYPIRNDSGICLSSVMAKINGTRKIIGKIARKTPFQKDGFLQKAVF